MNLFKEIGPQVFSFVYMVSVFSSGIYFLLEIKCIQLIIPKAYDMYQGTIILAISRPFPYTFTHSVCDDYIQCPVWKGGK